MSDTPIGERLASIEAKLDTFIAAQTDHGTRIRAIEKWMWSLPTALIISIGSAIAAFTKLR